jgi:hypothetical protein
MGRNSNVLEGVTKNGDLVWAPKDGAGKKKRMWPGYIDEKDAATKLTDSKTKVNVVFFGNTKLSAQVCVSELTNIDLKYVDHKASLLASGKSGIPAMEGLRKYARDHNKILLKEPELVGNEAERHDGAEVDSEELGEGAATLTADVAKPSEEVETSGASASDRASTGRVAVTTTAEAEPLASDSTEASHDAPAAGTPPPLLTTTAERYTVCSTLLLAGGRRSSRLIVATKRQEYAYDGETEYNRAAQKGDSPLLGIDDEETKARTLNRSRA